MKRIFSIAVLELLIAYGVFTALSAVSPLAFYSGGKWFRPPCDFSLRMTEIACLKTGTNPFDVWHGDVVKAPFRPNVNSKVSGVEFTEEINAYAPWEYTYMYPFSFLPRSGAWAIYFCLMAFAFCYLYKVGFEVALSRLGTREDARIASAGALLLIAYPTWSNACIGNFSILVLASLVAMARALDKGREIRAGFFWALAMVKPQLAILFAVPLLVRRQFLTCFTAGAICLLASCFPAALCHVSPITLILQTPAANTFMFHGCGTWPAALCGFFGGSVDIGIALANGFVLCLALTLMLPKKSKWICYLTPTAVCSASWTYVSTYGHVMAWFFMIELLLCLPLLAKSHGAKIFLAFALLFCTRGYDALYGFLNAFKERFPAWSIPEPIHWHLDSLNSFIDLGLYLCFFIWMAHNRKFECQKNEALQQQE